MRGTCLSSARSAAPASPAPRRSCRAREACRAAADRSASAPADAPSRQSRRKKATPNSFEFGVRSASPRSACPTPLRWSAARRGVFVANPEGVQRRFAAIEISPVGLPRVERCTTHRTTRKDAPPGAITASADRLAPLSLPRRCDPSPAWEESRTPSSIRRTSSHSAFATHQVPSRPDWAHTSRTLTVDWGGPPNRRRFSARFVKLLLDNDLRLSERPSSLSQGP